MAYKNRTKSITLQIMESLESRMSFTYQNKKYLINLQEGHVGETSLDKLTDCLGDQFLVLNDLYLKPKFSKSFQIDALIVAQQTIYLYEIKNYDGEYFYGEEMFFREPDLEVNNPLLQLQTNKNGLTILQRELSCSFEIKSYVVFINPEFTLFNSPDDKRLLMHSQLNKHFSQMKTQNKMLSSDEIQLASQLIAHTIKATPFYDDIPNYSFPTLKKGLCCEKCHSFHLIKKTRVYTCLTCEHNGKISSALMACMLEYQLLFPDDKFTTRIIYHWCGGEVTLKRIQRAFVELGKNEP